MWSWSYLASLALHGSTKRLMISLLFAQHCWPSMMRHYSEYCVGGFAWTCGIGGMTFCFFCKCWFNVSSNSMYSNYLSIHLPLPVIFLFFSVFKCCKVCGQIHLVGVGLLISVSSWPSFQFKVKFNRLKSWLCERLLIKWVGGPKRAMP